MISDFMTNILVRPYRMARKRSTMVRMMSPMKRHLNLLHTMNFMVLHGLVNQKKEVSGRLMVVKWRVYWFMSPAKLCLFLSNCQLRKMDRYVLRDPICRMYKRVCFIRLQVLTWEGPVLGSCWVRPCLLLQVSHLHLFHLQSPVSSQLCPVNTRRANVTMRTSDSFGIFGVYNRITCPNSEKTVAVSHCCFSF